MRLCLIMLALTFACPVHARLYQWVDPYTGTTQLSGTAPAWYRGPNPGPRVLVFEHGELVDDTAIELVPAERERLRDAARVGPAIALPQTAVAPDVPDVPDVPDLPAASAAPEASAPAASTTAPPTADTVAQAAVLKQLIDAWDRQQLEHARSLLELVPERAPAPQ